MWNNNNNNMRTMKMVLSRPQPFMIHYPVEDKRTIPQQSAKPKNARDALMQPMISRVHKAKSGCSSCGKKG